MRAQHRPIVGLLLAAGKASRFRAATGRDKLTEPIPMGLPYAGIPVIAASVNALLAACDEVLAVIDANNRRAIGLVEALGGKVLPAASEGTGQSIALGVAARREASGWLVALADMPFIRVSTIKAVAEALTRAPIAAPSYKSQRGHPVGFARSQGAALTELRGDEGARAILAHAKPLLIETDDPGVLHDIDSPEDWKVGK